MDTTNRNLVGTIVTGVIAVVYLAFIACLGWSIESIRLDKLFGSSYFDSKSLPTADFDAYVISLMLTYLVHAIVLGVACVLHNAYLIYTVMGIGMIEILVQVVEHFHKGMIPVWWSYMLFSLVATALWTVAHLKMEPLQPYEQYLCPLSSADDGLPK